MTNLNRENCFQQEDKMITDKFPKSRTFRIPKYDFFNTSKLCKNVVLFLTVERTPDSLQSETSSSFLRHFCQNL